MKKKKLTIENLEVSSFVTTLQSNAIKGGRPECPNMTMESCVDCSHDLSACHQSTGNTDDPTGWDSQNCNPQ